jgi:hypothetical protein
MSNFLDYKISQVLSSKDVPFYALLFSLIRKADSNNLHKLESVFPDEVAEFKKRYMAPAGALTNDELNSSERCISIAMKFNDDNK